MRCIVLFSCAELHENSLLSARPLRRPRHQQRFATTAALGFRFSLTANFPATVCIVCRSMRVAGRGRSGGLMHKGRQLARWLSRSLVALLLRAGVTNGALTTLTITSQANAATVSDLVNIACRTSGRISWVNFYVDSLKLGSNPPSTISWDSTRVVNGQHPFQSMAILRTDR